MFVLTTLKANGGGAVALEFARRLAEQGASVEVCTSRFHGDAAVHAPENGQLRFLTTAPVLASPALSMLWLFSFAAWRSWRRGPRLVYTHCATALVPNFSSARPVWLMQDMDYAFVAGPLRLVLKTLFVKAARASQIVTTNERLERFLRRCGFASSYSGALGISRDFEHAPYPVPRRYDVLLIAKPGLHKAGERTRRLAVVLASRGHEVCLVDQMPEPGPTPSAALKRLPVQQAEQMRALMRQARCFVCLSVREGYGLPPLEALASGCDVVTTRIPSVRGLDHPRLIRIARRLDDAAVLDVVERLLDRESACDHLYDGPWVDDWARGAARAALQET